MAKITITVTDHPIDGSVSFEVDPPMQQLLERKRRFGVKSLSSAEVYATIALAHMLEHAGSKVQEGRSQIIIPGMTS